MSLEGLKKQWQKILIDVGKSETEVAKDLGVNQTSFSRKIRTETIKAVELDRVLRTLGYELNIDKVKPPEE